MRIHSPIATLATCLLLAPALSDADDDGYLKAYTNALPNHWDQSGSYQQRYPDGCVPPGVINTSNKMVDGLAGLVTRCVEEQGALADAAADAGRRVDELDALVKSSSQVGDATDLAGQVLDQVEEFSELGKAIADDLEAENKRLGNNTAASQWKRRGKRCDWLKKTSGKTLKRLNLAHETAAGMKWVCECLKDQCVDWKEAADEDAAANARACDTLREHHDSWKALAGREACDT